MLPAPPSKDACWLVLQSGHGGDWQMLLSLDTSKYNDRNNPESTDLELSPPNQQERANKYNQELVSNQQKQQW